MSSESNQALVRRYVAVLNTHNLAGLDDVLVPDYLHHDPNLPPDLQHSREGHKQAIAPLVGAFPDVQGTIDDLITEGDKVVTRETYRGTHQGELMGIAPTGKPVTISLIRICRMAGGQIAEGWVVFDVLGMLQQIGALPPP